MIGTVGAISDAAPDRWSTLDDHDPKRRGCLPQKIGCDKGAAHATADDYYSFHVHEGYWVECFAEAARWFQLMPIVNRSSCDGHRTMVGDQVQVRGCLYAASLLVDTGYFFS
jgi:hypothetical protein